MWAIGGLSPAGQGQVVSGCVLLLLLLLLLLLAAACSCATLAIGSGGREPG